MEQRHNAHVFVIRTSDTPVVGYCSVWMILDELHIHDLAVRQRLGAGATLLERTMSAARAFGHDVPPWKFERRTSVPVACTSSPASESLACASATTQTQWMMLWFSGGSRWAGLKPL